MPLFPGRAAIPLSSSSRVSTAAPGMPSRLSRGLAQAPFAGGIPLASRPGRAAPTAFPTKFDEGGSAGFISKADEQQIARNEAGAQASPTFWDRAFNRRPAAPAAPQQPAQPAWGDPAGYVPPPPPPGWKPLSDQTREEAYDPTKDYRDPRNMGIVDRTGRVNPMYDITRDQSRNAPPLRQPGKPATKLSSSQAITNRINKMIGPPQEPPPVLPQDFVPGINLRPQFSSDYDVPPDAQPGAAPPAVASADPTLYPSVWGLPSFQQSDYPPGSRRPPVLTGGTPGRGLPSMPSMQDYIEWRNRQLENLSRWGGRLGITHADGGRVGFAGGGSAYEQALAALMKGRGADSDSEEGGMSRGADADDFMASLSLGQARGPSSAVLAPFLAAPALPASAAAASGAGGSGGMGDMMGSVAKMAPMIMNMFGGGGGGGGDLAGMSGFGFAEGGSTDDFFMPSISQGQVHSASTPALAPLLPPPTPAASQGGGGGGGGGGLLGGLFGGGGGGGGGGMMSSIMSMAPLAMMAFSDERLKENIQPVGKTRSGMNLIKYNMKGSPQTQVGLSAQDVERKRPGAVGNVGGYKTVDYERALRANGGPMPMMRGGYPQLLQAPPQRRAFSTGGGDSYVHPDGHGNGRSDHIDAALSPGEFVMDAETTSMLGDGDNEAGARQLEGLRQKVRQHKGRALAQGKFSPKAKAPEQYLSSKLTASDRLAHSYGRRG